MDRGSGGQRTMMMMVMSIAAAAAHRPLLLGCFWRSESPAVCTGRSFRAIRTPAAGSPAGCRSASPGATGTRSLQSAPLGRESFSGCTVAC
uniref:Putative secreted protein n=1 Tax=Anopheles darlingi TaxID=43151 RepID=A0A2M4DKK3_ANODA